MSVPHEQLTADERKLAKLFKRTKEPGGLGRAVAWIKIRRFAGKIGEGAFGRMILRIGWKP